MDKGIRLVYVEQFCNYCPKWRKMIHRFNKKLHPAAEKITVVPVESTMPELNFKQTQVTPEVYIDGVMITGITSTAYAWGYLEGLLEDEMILQ